MGFLDSWFGKMVMATPSHKGGGDSNPTTVFPLIGADVKAASRPSHRGKMPLPPGKP
jgi:hypothetical protein